MLNGAGHSPRLFPLFGIVCLLSHVCSGCLHCCLSWLQISKVGQVVWYSYLLSLLCPLVRLYTIKVASLLLSHRHARLCASRFLRPLCVFQKLICATQYGSGPPLCATAKVKPFQSASTFSPHEYYQASLSMISQARKHRTRHCLSTQQWVDCLNLLSFSMIRCDAKAWSEVLPFSSNQFGKSEVSTAHDSWSLGLNFADADEVQ